MRVYTFTFALTLLLSAALLFSIQPMFSKMVLPMLGGTPQVWNTAMLFFQAMLLAGYAYAHGTTRLFSIRTQALVHIILLIIFLAVLPIAIPNDWHPPVNKDPTIWQLTLMFITIGGPFFVLSGSAPMLQRWFTKSAHKDADNPYFLYGASNLGSMASLLAYPAIIEPLWNTAEQSLIWSWGYGALIFSILTCIILIWKNADAAVDRAPTSKQSKPITWAKRAIWLLLAFTPSSLMLGVTTHITTDIAAVPLIWIMPLAIYVSSFIVAFARKQYLTREHMHFAQGIMIIGIIAISLSPLDMHQHFFLAMALHLTAFAFCALVCHCELARTRPDASHLTEFYLIMSIGGALGGVFNAIIAPQFFLTHFEYNIAVILACALRWAADLRLSSSDIKKTWNQISLGIIAIAFIGLYFVSLPPPTLLFLIVFITTLILGTLLKERWSFAIAVFIILTLFPLSGGSLSQSEYKTIERKRNFFGSIKVAQNEYQRSLIHGTTNHGTQALEEKYRLIPLSYYSPVSPLSDAFEYLDYQPGKQKIAVLGLGVGVTACFQKDGRHFDFYEINPQVVEIATNPEYFTFLSDCGSPYDIILGDGRLTIQEKPDHTYDLIVLDAFTSDNIPIHLITKEAVEIYFKKLKPNGLIVFNISNRQLTLEPVLAEISDDLGKESLAKLSLPGEYEDSGIIYYTAHYTALFSDKDIKTFLEKMEWSPTRHRKGVKAWSDDYSNIISVLYNDIAIDRIRERSKKEAGRRTD